MQSSSFQLNINTADYRVTLLGSEALDRVCELENLAHSHPWSRNLLESGLQRYQVYGLWQQQLLVGFAVISQVVDEAELLDFVIDPKCQGQGLGTGFMAGLLSRVSEKAKRFYLEVRVSNVAAIALYQTSGFVEVGVRQGYYPSKQGREDALLMAMELFG